jgi:hypothetical protein
MKRRLIALWVVLAIVLQGPMVAYASTAPNAGCAMMQHRGAVPAAAHHDGTRKPCCPDSAPTATCCISGFEVAAGPVNFSLPTRLAAYAIPLARPLAVAFASRGDSPLIRPPIL